MSFKLTQSVDSLEWNNALKGLPNPHLLQTWQWGDVKSRYGWAPTRLLWRDASANVVAAAQILKRQIMGLFDILYCPRGPILDWSNHELRSHIVDDLKKFTLGTGTIFLKVDPEVFTSREETPGSESVHEPLGDEIQELLTDAGFLPSEEQIQFRNSMQLDLRPSEDEILARMKQKTRYNIRLASRKGVQAFLGTQDDFDLLYRIYAETSLRDQFAIRQGAYYQDVWNTFHHAGMAQPFIAAVDGQPVAGLILFRYGDTAWYLYGMSRDLHREKMPNYLLQWEAIKWAKATGSSTYDFWGAPDDLDPSDPLWGVYRFKSGFGARFVRTVGAWDLISRPLLHRLYSSLLPRILSLLRVRGRSQTQRALQ